LAKDKRLWEKVKRKIIRKERNVVLPSSLLAGGFVAQFICTRMFQPWLGQGFDDDDGRYIRVAMNATAKPSQELLLP
jgi:hypothetical protein